MTRVTVVLGDITTESVDAVVNAANSALVGGGGVDGAIHAAAGPTVMQECRVIAAEQGGCPPGSAVATGAGALACRWIIHTVGPIWDPASAADHDATLGSAYTSSLDLAAELGARSVSFPNISTGVYGFPKDRAAAVAIAEVEAWIARHPEALDHIRFVCFDDANRRLYVDAGLPQS